MARDKPKIKLVPKSGDSATTSTKIGPGVVGRNSDSHRVKSTTESTLSSSPAAVEAAPSTQKRSLNVPEVAAYLCLKVSRIRYLVHTMQIPFSKYGQSLRFDLSEIEKSRVSKVVLTMADLETSERQKRKR